MNRTFQRNFYVYVTGFTQDTDRATFKNEFGKFGKVEKLFLEASGKYAKVFYSTKESCDLAVQELNNSALRWQVEHSFAQQAADNNPNQSPFFTSSKVSNMASYRGRYDDDDEDFVENFDYCNIHGQPLIVLQADTGDLYVNLKDIKKTGFALFRRDTFDSILVDKRQIGKEFELHLLSEAKNYILKNKVAAIQEEDILKTIERCKNKLLGEDSSYDNRNSFGAGRSVAPSKTNITVTADLHSSPATANLPTSASIPHQRPPKTLPDNFMPSNKPADRYSNKSQERVSRTSQNGSYRNNDTKHNSNNNRERNNFLNGFEIPKENRANVELNTSNSSDSKVEKRAKPVVEQNEERIPVKDDIGKLVLDVGSTYETQIVFIEDKENICWVQKKSDAGFMEELLLQINEMEENLRNIKPVVGQLVIAQFEEAWCRGRVCSLNPLTVHFIDYGNKSPVENVKPLPDTFKKTSALAARIKINKTRELNKEMTELTIKVRQQYDDGTYLVNLINSVGPSSETEVSPAKPPEEKTPEEVKQKYYFEIPKPMVELKNGDKIMVVDVEKNKFLVRTKECAQKCKEITEYVKTLDKSALILPNAKVGQLVLCSKDGMVGLYRAIITKRESASVITVKYIDFSGEDDLSIKSIRNVDSFLANEPSCILLTPECKGVNDANEKVSEYISEICQKKEKFTVILSDGEFDLELDNGKLLSEKLSELKSPKKIEEVKAPKSKQGLEMEKVPERRKSLTKITYDDMDWITVKSGTHSFLCYHFNGLDDVTMIDSREEVINYFEEITGLEVTDDTPYAPEELEMCLVSYKSPDDEEASWCRATVLSVEEDGYDVSFVDFGNKERIKKKDIRKFPPKLKDIPMLGINCELVGLPNKLAIVKRIKELLPEGDQVDVIVKELSANAHHKYKIEIPTIYKSLQTEGLY